MKKAIVFLAIITTFLIIPFVGVEAKAKKTTKKTTTTTTTTTVAGKKVNMYVFYGDGCPHCAELHEWLEELDKDSSINYMYDIVNIEVWGDKDNANLLTDVAAHFGQKKPGVPFVVIGDNFTVGYNSSVSPDEIKGLILKEYKNTEYLDVVAGIKDGTLTKASSKNRVVGFIIVGVMALVLVGIILASNFTNNKYYEKEN